MPDAISALGLGAVERRVGQGDEIRPCLRMIGNAEAGRDGNAVAARRQDLVLLHRKADFFSQREGIRRRLSAEQDCKLLAAVPGYDVGRSQGGACEPGDLLENVITRQVAMIVVDGLEMIDVHQQQARRLLLPAATHSFLPDAIERRAIRQPGEPVGFGLQLQLLREAGALLELGLENVERIEQAAHLPGLPGVAPFRDRMLLGKPDGSLQARRSGRKRRA